MKQIVLSSLILLGFNLSSFAKSCPDTMAIDQLPIGKTILVINASKQYLEYNPMYESYGAGKEVSVNKRLTEKGFVKELLLNWVKHPGRSINLKYENIETNPQEYLGPSKFILTHKKVKLDPPDEPKFDGILHLDFTKTRYIFESKFTFQKIGSVDPIEITLTPERSILDPRQRTYFNLGSLKYNLGKDFILSAECD